MPEPASTQPVEPSEAADEPEPNIPPEAFRPTVGRCWFAVLVAVAAFFVPQEIPLEWYPLNNPSSGLRYLEIKCAANVTGNTQILLNFGRWSEINKIRWRIGPSEMTFTYTFPLTDAPLRELRIDPLDKPGELVVENFRLLNRRGEELRRFSKDDLRSLHDVTVTPTENGWKFTVTGASGGWAHIDFSHFSAPEGMNHRNFLRCLYSTSYLAMMLLILLLAVFFAFYWPASWREFGKYLSYLALLGIAFSFVGNRGLIRNSIRYARTELPPPSGDFHLEMDVNAPKPAAAQLFWDTGGGISQQESARWDLENTAGMQTLRFPLPTREIRSLRFDPIDRPGQLTVRRIRLVDGNGDVRATFPPDSFEPANQIAKIERSEGHGLAVPDRVLIESTPNGFDPFVKISDRVVNEINSVRKGGIRPDKGEWPPAAGAGRTSNTER